MGIKLGLTEMIITMTRTELYCDCCGNYIGTRCENKGSVWHEHMNKNWKYCPYCGEPLELEWM